MTNPNFRNHLQLSRVFLLFLQEGQYLKFRCGLVPHIQQLQLNLSHKNLDKLERLLPYKSLWSVWFFKQGFLSVLSILQVNQPQTFISLIRARLLDSIYLILKVIYKLILIFTFSWTAEAKCVGRFVNPITDICWKCIFPLTISGVEVASGNPSPSTRPGPICWCNRPPFNQPTPGIPIGFWEPARLVDITRTPYCLVNMGGMQIANTGIRYRGDVEEDPDMGSHHSFYHVHWYVYPIIYWLEVLTDFLCLENSAIDLAYLTELDPLWNDDEKSFILNPEAVLFGNPIAQAACAADCVAASAKLPLNPLFWCSGCQGSLYPFAGTLNDHMGGVQASLLITGRFMAKLHREGLLWGTLGINGLCDKYPMPIIKKSQYRFQMTYPIPTTTNCYPMGHTEVTWQGGREFPYKGSDFGYLIWRKKDCCLL